MQVIDWIIAHAAELFSGIGVTLVVAAGTLFRALRDRQNRSAAVVAEARQRAVSANAVRSAPRSPVGDWMTTDLAVAQLTNEDSSRQCSFCRKSEKSVKRLVAGPGANICDECLETGLDKLDETSGSATKVKELCELTLMAASPTFDHTQRSHMQTMISELAMQIRKRRRERPGDVVTGAKLIRAVGAGNFGTVWEASLVRRKRAFSGPVAVKIFDQDKLGQGLMLWRFQRGLRAMKYFSDLGQRVPPSIIRYVDHADDQLSFCMEFMPGGDLQNLHSRKLSMQRRLELFCQVAEAVSFAHDQGVIHRDIKPANVILNASGDAVLTDFDIADLTFAHTQSIYSGGLGTPQFAAPEQLVGHELVAHPSCDVFSLGKLLYFLLMEKAPPIGSIDEGHEPNYLRQISPTPLRTGIQRALCTEALLRPQSVKELLKVSGLSLPHRVGS